METHRKARGKNCSNGQDMTRSDLRSLPQNDDAEREMVRECVGARRQGNDERSEAIFELRNNERGESCSPAFGWEMIVELATHRQEQSLAL